MILSIKVNVTSSQLMSFSLDIVPVYIDSFCCVEAQKTNRMFDGVVDDQVVITKGKPRPHRDKISVLQRTRTLPFRWHEHTKKDQKHKKTGNMRKWKNIGNAKTEKHHKDEKTKNYVNTSTQKTKLTLEDIKHYVKTRT